MPRIDNGRGAESNFHVSPTVASKPTLSVPDSGDVYDTDAGVLPSAAGAEGTPLLRQPSAVQSDKLEY